ncbi:hypothetical protein [Umezawaea beigongshangensis]|uniref:hypothetical protein n=1 Tax=Umezawaea beigongshangensis TaxID=2780383 RepID=UPI0018F20DB1|nr:hypothetical protein [Umezawaea beigongshangensis]
MDELIRRPGGASRQLPIVQVIGSRGAGRTALLRAVEQRCRTRVPHAFVDVEENHDVRPSVLLGELAFQLNRRCPQFGRIPFPRLLLCALVVTGDLDLRDRSKALLQLDQLMKQDGVVGRRRDTVLDVARLAGESGVLPGWALVAADVLLTGLGRIARRNALRTIRNVSRGAADDPRDLLVDLNAKDRGSAADRRVVDEMFFDAFLSDLRAAYTGLLDRDRRTANCVVLLDNAHTADGRAFLAGLLAARERAGTAYDPVVVLATSRTWNSDWSADWQRPGTTSTARPLPRTAARAAEECGTLAGRGRWYLTRIGHLAPDDCATVLNGTGPPVRRDFPHRLTGGHPWALAGLRDLLARHDAPERLGGLLSVRPDPERDETFADHAVDHLLRDFADNGLLADLVTASALRDIEFVADEGVLLCGQPDGGGALYNALVNNLLLVQEEEEGGEPRVVLDRWLRTLLLHRLARRDDTGQDGWSAVHTRCRDHYLALDRRAEARYHDLALGDVGAVVVHLAKPFGSPDAVFDQDAAEAWLRDLDLITSAPHRSTADQDPLEVVEDLIEHVPPAGRFGHALPRLVAALWVTGDPLGDPAGVLAGRIRSSYRELARVRGQGSILLHDRAETYGT